MFIFLIFLFFGILIQANQYENDLTIVGPIKFQDGIGRIAIAIFDTLKSDVKISIKPTCMIETFDKNLHEIKQLLTAQKKNSTNICLFTDLLSSNFVEEISGQIKIAYSMIESTQIPSSWLQALNNKFDAVIVPDKNLVSVYKNSGVKIPIFVLPIPLYLENFLDKPARNRPNKIFCFGMSGGIGSGKNQSLLVEAFCQEFGNNSNVELKLHGRNTCGDEIVKVKNYIKKYKIKNVKLIIKAFSEKEYENFMNSLDCYVLLSKGEGFSITPREAIALGIPCILSNVGAHKTLCQTGIVFPVKCNIPVINEFFKQMFGDFCGNQFTASINNARAALKEVYSNYSHYLNIALKNRQWAKQYLCQNLKKSYLTLIKPSRIELGTENLILEEQSKLVINSETLYRKYMNLIKA